MHESFESGAGAGVMEEIDERDEARHEIQALVDDAKEHMEEWKKGEAVEGYYPHAEGIDTNVLTDEDIDFWNHVKSGDATREDFDEYDANVNEEMKTAGEGEEEQRIKKVRGDFRALTAQLFEKQQLEREEESTGVE